MTLSTQAAADASTREARRLSRTAALGVILSTARVMPELSANDVRATLDDLGVAPQVRGPVWAEAVRLGVVRPIALERSRGRSAHNKAVSRYASLIYAGEAA